MKSLIPSVILNCLRARSYSPFRVLNMDMPDGVEAGVGVVVVVVLCEKGTRLGMDALLLPSLEELRMLTAPSPRSALLLSPEDADSPLPLKTMTRLQPATDLRKAGTET